MSSRTLLTNKHGARAAAAASWALALTLAATAWGQPNPFEAHEDSTKEVEEAPVEVQRPEPPIVVPDQSASFRQGAFSLGADTLFNYTTTTNGLPDGGEVDNTTLFFRLTPTFGYFAVDQIEVSLSLGALSRQLDRGGNQVSSENDLLIMASGRYFIPLVNRFALYADLGLGGYFGSSDRNLSAPLSEGATPTKINEQTDTSGVAFSGSIGASYILADQVQLRAGLGTMGLIGSEEIISLKKSLDVTTFNTGLSIGLFYLF